MNWPPDRREYQNSTTHDPASDNHHHALKQMFGARSRTLYPAISFGYWAAKLLHFICLYCQDIWICCSTVRFNTARDKHSCGRGGDVECVQILQSWDLPLFLATFPWRYSGHSISLDEQWSRGKMTQQKEPLKTNQTSDSRMFSFSWITHLFKPSTPVFQMQ